MVWIYMSIFAMKGCRARMGQRKNRMNDYETSMNARKMRFVSVIR